MGITLIKKPMLADDKDDRCKNEQQTNAKAKTKPIPKALHLAKAKKGEKEMICHYAYHIYDMNTGDFGKIVSKHFSYKEALAKLKDLEDKNDGTHEYVIL